MRFTETALAMAILCLDIPGVIGIPTLPTQQNAPNQVTKLVDCQKWDTPYSCDIFCYAVFCLQLPSVLTHDKNQDRAQDRRKESGNTLRPFNDAGVEKYQTIRRNNDPNFKVADEYPPASCKEGGDGSGKGRAILQGATQHDQSLQGNWLQQLWDGVGDGDTVALDVTNWKPELSPNCEARQNNDRSRCSGVATSPYFRKSDAKGPNGKTVFDHMGN